MLIKASGFELEIREDAFVCLEEGETSHFCEWSRMDADLRKIFLGLQNDLSKVMADFLRSDKTRGFFALSDRYEDSSGPGCAGRQTLDEMPRRAQ